MTWLTLIRGWNEVQRLRTHSYKHADTQTHTHAFCPICNVLSKTNNQTNACPVFRRPNPNQELKSQESGKSKSWTLVNRTAMEEFISLWLGSMLYTDLSYPTFYWGEQIRQERRVSSRFDLRIRCRWRRMSNLLSVRLRAAVRYFGPWNFERTVLDCFVWAHSFHKAPRASAI